jgi:hypothetical protein
MDPGPVIPDLIRDRGDGLLKDPGFVRAFFPSSPAHAPALVAATGRSYIVSERKPRFFGKKFEIRISKSETMTKIVRRRSLKHAKTAKNSVMDVILYSWQTLHRETFGKQINRWQPSNQLGRFNQLFSSLPVEIFQISAFKIDQCLRFFFQRIRGEKIEIDR